MSAIDDLNTAVANLASEQAAVTTAVTDLLAEISNLQAGISASDDSAIEAAVGNINAIAASLGTAAASDPGVPTETASPTSSTDGTAETSTPSADSSDSTPAPDESASPTSDASTSTPSSDAPASSTPVSDTAPAEASTPTSDAPAS